ncbi:MAG TPA: glycoside hydrolase family 3 N-terminal domain-containing protein [Gemmatimonadaceae bacterium]|nr:glycoside hydrolase family 3 N-terminal domain-containing protein [Gemmatimonadaceae bacterium]
MTRFKLAVPLVCALVVAAPRAASQSPDASAQRIERLVRQMTLEEKVGQMTQLGLQVILSRPGGPGTPAVIDSAKLHDVVVKRGVGALLNVAYVAMSPEEWRAANDMIARFAARSRLKVPVVYGIDAVHGQHYQTTSTIFPQNIAMAATFNPGLVRRSSEITAYETRASGIAWNFAPVLDLGRHPAWPRYYETFGEDPYVASVLGREAVLGNQLDPFPAINALLGTNAARPRIGGRVFVAASAKHFLGYSMPLSGKDRTTAWIPERELREYFLPSFRAAIQAGISTVMVNSADINGIPVHVDRRILTDLLRRELGFTGVTDSDWEDIIRLYRVHRVAKDNKDAVRQAVMAGIDMSMVPDNWSFTDDLIALVKEGAVPMSRIDEAVRRILRLKSDLGLFENPLPEPSMIANIGAPAFQAVSRDAAAEAITLLKNEGGLLPLAKTAKVLVTGPTANHVPAMYGGWSYTWQGTDTLMYPKGIKTLLDAVRDKVGAANVTYVPGASFTDTLDVAAAVTAARGANVAIVAIGEGAYAETPGNIDDITLPQGQLRLARAIEQAGVPVVLALYHGRPRILRDAVDGARAIVTGYETGPYGGEAMAGVLFGDINPSGKLPFSWPRFTNAILIPYDRARGADIGGTDTTNRGYNPEWPFGHGLSYTTFAYSNLRVATPTVGPRDSVRVSVTVTNTGQRAGKESVLLYVRDVVASVTPPVRRLRRFEKISLEPGASRTVSFSLAARELSFVGRDDRLVLEPGAFEAIVGTLTAPFEVTNRP